MSPGAALRWGQGPGPEPRPGKPVLGCGPPQPSTGKTLPPDRRPASIPPAAFSPSWGPLPAARCPCCPSELPSDPGSEGHSEDQPAHPPSLTPCVSRTHRRGPPSTPARPGHGQAGPREHRGWAGALWVAPRQAGRGHGPGSRLGQAAAQTPRKETPDTWLFPGPLPLGKPAAVPRAPSPETLAGLMPPGWCPRPMLRPRTKGTRAGLGQDVSPRSDSGWRPGLM